MSPVPVQRTGSWSGLNFYEEGTWDSDSGIAAGFSAPLAGASGLRAAQQLLSVPVFKGDQRPFGKVLGPKTFAGKIPPNLEFTFLGRLLVVFFGRSGYSRPHAGSSSLHRFLISSTAGQRGSCQWESFSKETTQVVMRGRGSKIQNINFRLGTSGPATYDVDVLGIGDIVTGSSIFQSITDDGLVPTTYFNGSLNIKGNSAQDLTGASISLMGNVQRTEVFNNSGIAGSLPEGNIEPKGSLQFMLTTSGSNEGADLNAWNDAVAGTEVGVDCIWTDQPIGGPAFPTRYLRIYQPTVRMGAASFAPGGMAGLGINQNFEAARSVSPNSASSAVAAENFGTIGGPYALTGSVFNLGFKIDGGATITVNVGTTTQTAAQVVAALNANGGFSAKAIADVYLGNYVRIKSKSTGGAYGATTSVQCDTAVANTAHALFGFDNAVVSGVSNCELYVEVWNTLGASY